MFSEKTSKKFWFFYYHRFSVLGQKDCDLPKSYSYNQLPNAGSSDPGGGRLNISSGICEPHNLHHDQVKLFKKSINILYAWRLELWNKIQLIVHVLMKYALVHRKNEFYMKFHFERNVFLLSRIFFSLFFTPYQQFFYIKVCQ